MVMNYAAVLYPRDVFVSWLPDLALIYAVAAVFYFEVLAAAVKYIFDAIRYELE
jgi:hypothetical protein